MTQQTRVYKPGVFIITLAVLSIGVLSGCGYCSPVLLTAIAGRFVIDGYRMVSDALSIQPLASI
jgi:hypothetical protein